MRLVPRLQRPVPFGRGERGELSDCTTDPIDQLSQEVLELRGDRLDGGRFVRRGIVDDPDADLLPGIDGYRQRIVRPIEDGEILNVERRLSRPQRGVDGIVLEDEQVLEQSRATRQVGHGGQIDEGQTGVQITFQLALLQVQEPRRHGLIGIDPDANRYAVDEESDHLFGTWKFTASARYGGAEQDVVGATELAHRQRPRRLHEGIQGDVMLTGTMVEAGRRGPVQ